MQKQTADMLGKFIKHSQWNIFRLFHNDLSPYISLQRSSHLLACSALILSIFTVLCPQTVSQAAEHFAVTTAKQDGQMQLSCSKTNNATIFTLYNCSSIGGGAYWAGLAAARPLFGSCGPPYLARPLFLHDVNFFFLYIDIMTGENLQ